MGGRFGSRSKRIVKWDPFPRWWNRLVYIRTVCIDTQSRGGDIRWNASIYHGPSNDANWWTKSKALVYHIEVGGWGGIVHCCGGYRAMQIVLRVWSRGINWKKCNNPSRIFGNRVHVVTTQKKIMDLVYLFDVEFSLIKNKNGWELMGKVERRKKMKIKKIESTRIGKMEFQKCGKRGNTNHDKRIFLFIFIFF